MKQLSKVSIVVFLGFFLVSGLSALSQEDDAGKEKEPYKMKMAQAWLKYNDEDYYGALRIYRDLYRSNPEDGMLNYRMGRSFMEVRKMDTALIHLEKAAATDVTNKDIHFYLGKVHQYNNNLDKAIDAYYNYKASLKPKQNETHFVNVLLRQCHTAKEMMEKPVNVEMRNLKEINSEYTDANPSLTADGKTLIFTSRNPSTTGGKVDYNVEEYFDDVYYSTWNSETKTWNTAVNFGEPINTEGHDANMSISPDGNTIYLYKNILGETKSGDIYFSKKSGDKWSKPKAFEPENKAINTTYFESSACITSDGNTMFFVSEREKGGYGNGDIYWVRRLEDGSWGRPENIGPIINTENDEIGVFIHSDGKTLFFSSNGHNTMGGHDIFMTVFENGRWSTPVNLGYPINTTQEEVHFIFTTDRKTAYLASSRDGGKGKYDIYEIDMQKYFSGSDVVSQEIKDIVTGPPMAILRGTIVDSKTSEPLKATINITDMSNNKTKVITSDENGAYFITLPADRRYEVKVDQSGYKPVEIKFKLPKGEDETPTLIKHLVLDRN
ncbi:MAG: PD40 domain-containing protein [Bacteroidales bacterium]|nr:PD40 domain-containing protein [Bacteroidales bacterium]